MEQTGKPKVIVRIAIPQDKEKLKAMLSDAYKNKQVYAVAVSQGKIIGYCQASGISRGKRTAEIEFVHVTPKMRNAGIGHQLLGKIHSFLIKRRKAAVTARPLTNAEGFYKRAGYDSSGWPLKMKLGIERLKHSRRIRKIRK